MCLYKAILSGAKRIAATVIIISHVDGMAQGAALIRNSCVCHIYRKQDSQLHLK